ncbi:MAG: chemotaxis protein CheW [Leptospirales bacterium]|nr:chemotaxis protein CheW [Leptospirales bacterium]
MAELASTFRRETLEILQRAEEAILSLEGGESAESIREIFRIVHTVKGNAGLFELPELVSAAHHLEDALAALRKHPQSCTPAWIDAMLQGVDVLRTLLTEAPPDSESRVAALRQTLQHLLADAGAAVEACETEPEEKTASHKNRTPLRLSAPTGAMLRAREENKSLHLLLFDAVQQRLANLSDLAKMFAALRDEGTLLEGGVLWERVPALNGRGASLPCFMFLLSEEAPASICRRSGIRAAQLKTLFRAQSILDTKQETPAAESSASAAVATKVESPEAAAAGRVMPATEAEGQKADNLRVSLGLIDEIINLTGETVIARNDLLQRVEKHGNQDLLSAARKISRLITSMQERIMRTRLQQLDLAFRRLPRIVHDACRATAKKAELVIEGGETELDKTLIDAILDPLTHCVRNSVDHGIESPEERRRAGKPEAGLIRVSAAMSGGSVVITVRDDGRGLDLEAIRATAVRRGVMSDAEARAADEERLRECLFMPGFSTRDSVSETSGRGVGMDVVRSRVEAAGGSVELSSEAGRGMELAIHLPQTLAIITCLLVRQAGTRFAIPEKHIEEMLTFDDAQAAMVRDRTVYNLRGRMLPYVDLSEILNGEAGAHSGGYMVVLKTDRVRFGLRVDEVINPEEFVVRRLSDYFQNIRLYSGAGVMGDGEAILILDTAGIARSARLKSNLAETMDRREDGAAGASNRSFLLFRVGDQRLALDFADFPRLRRLAPGDLKEFLGRESVLQDERLVPALRLEQIRELGIQRSAEAAGRYAVFLGRAGEEAALLVDEVINVAAQAIVWEAERAGAGVVRNRALVDGYSVGLLDAAALLKASVRAGKVERQEAIA